MCVCVCRGVCGGVWGCVVKDVMWVCLWRSEDNSFCEVCSLLPPFCRIWET